MYNNLSVLSVCFLAVFILSGYRTNEHIKGDTKYDGKAVLQNLIESHKKYGASPKD